MINGITASKGVIWEIRFFIGLIFSLLLDYVVEAIKEPHNVQNMICGEICGFLLLSLYFLVYKNCASFACLILDIFLEIQMKIEEAFPPTSILACFDFAFSPTSVYSRSLVPLAVLYFRKSVERELV